MSHDLYAELEGVPEPTATSPFFRTLSLSSFSSGKTPTSSRLPSRSPSPTGSPSSSNAALGSASMSITRQEGAYIPQAPSYDESQAVYTGKSLQSGSTDDDRWITGTHDTHRTIMIVFNPNPTGQVSSLDEQVTGFTEGVGVYKWRMSADEVCPEALVSVLTCSGISQHGLCSDSSSQIQHRPSLFSHSVTRSIRQS